MNIDIFSTQNQNETHFTLFPFSKLIDST